MSPSVKVSPSTDDRSSEDFSGCSSLPLGEAQMYHAQLLDVAMKLLMNDVHPLAKALGMHEGQLADYRMPPDVEKGSVRLTMALFQSLKSRNMFSIALQNAGYSDIAKSLNLDCEPSLSELGSAVMEFKDDELSSLGKLLHLREDDVTACRDDTGTIDKLRLMSLWKNAVRPTPYNYRAALVRALQIVGVEASDTETSGKGQSSTGGGAAGEFTPEEMEYQRHVVLKLLPAEDTKGEGSDQMAKASLAWIKRWLPGLKPGKDFDIAGRIEVNNSLVGGNYSEVAREMMLLENQIMLLKTSNSLLQKFKRRVAKK
ncbi:uncharacterized protein [Diadema setosum]|uniref:uncharacterized protein n=1 Tax=Diadema setosum TaxID=31175 RepID=UPI003B3A754E